jgi:hypothetical protein
MRRLLILAALTTATIAIPTGTALAAPATPPVGTPSGSASCIAAFTDYLAHYDPNTGAVNHGVGTTMSQYATSGPHTIADFNTSINDLHGSLDNCLTTEP